MHGIQAQCHVTLRHQFACKFDYIKVNIISVPLVLAARPEFSVYSKSALRLMTTKHESYIPPAYCKIYANAAYA